jgi:hypothetical protein
VIDDATVLDLDPRREVVGEAAPIGSRISSSAPRSIRRGRAASKFPTPTSKGALTMPLIASGRDP